MAINKEPQPDTRAATWASTMAGHALPHSPSDIRFAHSDSIASTGAERLVSREEREIFEEKFLSPLATRATGSGVRSRVEDADPFRTCFERDRDRILHANAFRRLAGKLKFLSSPTTTSARALPMLLKWHK